MGLDAVWSEDFHHSARVAATGRSEGYYTDYRGGPQELISCVKRAFLYQGQRYQWQDGPRGTAVRDEPAEQFVFFFRTMTRWPISCGETDCTRRPVPVCIAP